MTSITDHILKGAATAPASPAGQGLAIGLCPAGMTLDAAASYTDPTTQADTPCGGTAQFCTEGGAKWNDQCGAKADSQAFFGTTACCKTSTAGRRLLAMPTAPAVSSAEAAPSRRRASHERPISICPAGLTVDTSASYFDVAEYKLANCGESSSFCTKDGKWNDGCGYMAETQQFFSRSRCCKGVAQGTICPAGMSLQADATTITDEKGTETKCGDLEANCVTGGTNWNKDCGDQAELQAHMGSTKCCAVSKIEVCCNDETVSCTDTADDEMKKHTGGEYTCALLEFACSDTNVARACAQTCKVGRCGAGDR